MTPLQQAHAAGMIEVHTFSGWIPLAGWSLPETRIDEFDLEQNRLQGPWRPLNSTEQIFADDHPERGFIKARDTWEVRP